MIDMLTPIFICIICGGVGVYLGWQAREYAAKKFVRSYFEQVADHNAKSVINITITREGEEFFIYNKDTGEFIAQGTSHKDISKILSDRFPSKIFMAAPNNLKDTGYNLHDAI